MATRSSFPLEDFEDNISFEENSQLLSTTDSIVGSSINRLQSSIHQHTREPTIEEKNRTKKRYFCKYCPDFDEARYHILTDGLRRHLK